MAREIKNVKVDTAVSVIKAYREELNSVEMTTSSRYLSLVRTSLELSRMWMGEVLGDLNLPTPYSNDGKRKTVADIHPTADTNEEVINIESIEDIDQLRERLKEIFNWFNVRQEVRHLFSTIFVKQHLAEARMWLGKQLEYLRDQDKEVEK